MGSRLHAGVSLAFLGGHIGIYVSGKAQKEVTPAIGNWLNERG